MTETKGKLSISRVTSNDPDESGWIEIALQDEHYKYLSITKVKFDEFAMAVTGLGSRECMIRSFPEKGSSTETPSEPSKGDDDL